MITDHELQQMERDGLVTIASPFTDEQVRAAAAAGDRAMGARMEGFISSGFAVPELMDLMLHDDVVATVRRVLRADHVVLRATALRKTAPKPDRKEGLEGEHADIRFSSDDLDATPRRIFCTVLIWLTDVPPRRAPFMFRPGSHRQLADAYTGTPSIASHGIETLPNLNYADSIPVIVPRPGMLSVGSTGVIHSGSINTDIADRKVIFTQWQARGIPDIVFPQPTIDAMRSWFDDANRVLPADKRELLRLGGN